MLQPSYSALVDENNKLRTVAFLASAMQGRIASLETYVGQVESERDACKGVGLKLEAENERLSAFMIEVAEKHVPGDVREMILSRFEDVSSLAVSTRDMVVRLGDGLPMMAKALVAEFRAVIGQIPHGANREDIFSAMQEVMQPLMQSMVARLTDAAQVMRDIRSDAAEQLALQKANAEARERAEAINAAAHRETQELMKKVLESVQQGQYETFNQLLALQQGVGVAQTATMESFTEVKDSVEGLCKSVSVGLRAGKKGLDMMKALDGNVIALRDGQDRFLPEIHGTVRRMEIQPYVGIQRREGTPGVIREAKLLGAEAQTEPFELPAFLKKKADEIVEEGDILLRGLPKAEVPDAVMTATQGLVERVLIAAE